MDPLQLSNIDNVLLTRRGHHIKGTLILSRFHLVFSYKSEKSSDKPREIWICYPMIERISRARGSSWSQNLPVGSQIPELSTFPILEDFDKYSSSHIRLVCKDFTYYSFDFCNDSLCSNVYQKLSQLVNIPKVKGTIKELYAFEYKPNAFEVKIKSTGWRLFNPEEEYQRQALITSDAPKSFWRLCKINENYRFCSSYPESFVVPSSISDSVMQHAGKFRSKQRVPAIVYKHNQGGNGNVIARCSQPLVGLNLQNRSLQDEKLIEEIFKSQNLERDILLCHDSELRDQPQRNLIVDLRPITNAMAQHALGAGTENVDNYRGKTLPEKNRARGLNYSTQGTQSVEKIFCNIDNIHVMRDSLDKLTKILSELDRYPCVGGIEGGITYSSLQHSLTKTQWLHHLFLILQAVDRITKSVHLNNTNVLIHCSDGWDRTSQVSALAQLCLDPYFRTFEGFMVLIEKEWLSFGFKFATRSDQGGCIGALSPKSTKESKQDSSLDNGILNEPSSVLDDFSPVNDPDYNGFSDGSAKKIMTSFLSRAASHIKNSASGSKSVISDNRSENYHSIYTGSNERSPVFHQFLDCVYQIYRQQPSKFEFNSRFLKRLLYHSYSCQYGTFLCNSEKERKLGHDLENQTTSVWSYFLSRRGEFSNILYDKEKNIDVLFFNYSEVKWWYELYGRSDEEMNGLSNSLDKKFAQLKLNKKTQSSDISPEGIERVDTTPNFELPS
ncbi:hypothetical protein JCM33374_g205 [Metschnikowia sp. JCM 33374]|nr:hypothetical protein JCM33374_g205 [Metschnikowia sp. JCM 33374]